MPSASLLVVVFVGTCPQSESFTGEFLLAKRSYRHCEGARIAPRWSSIEK